MTIGSILAVVVIIVAVLGLLGVVPLTPVVVFGLVLALAFAILLGAFGWTLPGPPRV